MELSTNKLTVTPRSSERKSGMSERSITELDEQRAAAFRRLKAKRGFKVHLARASTFAHLPR